MNEGILAIDVGGTDIKYALMDRERKIYEQGKVPTPHDGLEDYLSTLESIFRKYDGVSGIAMSVPGVIDMDKGICHNGGALLYIKEFPLADELGKRCGVPVTVMNDAKAAALAEVGSGVLSDVDDGIVILFGTGIGGALVKDKKLHCGKHQSAGEFSNILIGEELKQESLWAWHSSVLTLCAKAAQVKGVAPEEMNGVKVFDLAEAGDPDILQVLDEFTLEIAKMISNLQFIYDPERFAIGGGISSRPIFIETIRKYVNLIGSQYPEGVPTAQIEACRYRNDANLIGALENFMDRYPESK